MLASNLDISGLQVAMDDALLVSCFESVGNLARNRERLVERQRAARDSLCQIIADWSTSDIAQAGATQTVRAYWTRHVMLAATILRIWPKRARRALRVAPLPLRIVVATVLLFALWAAVNWTVQVVRKPTELFFPVSGSLSKAPAQTWQQYGSLFDKYSTAVITPELLAALAQMEGSGNPVARTYWRWRVDWNPFNVYQPASSAVGMFQITDGTFAEAKRYCIHDHKVAEAGPWTDLRSCWFNAIYTRVVPDHAVEMTAALLDRTVASTIVHNRVERASLQQRQDLAAVIHLCGSGAGNAFARRGFRLSRGQRCGDHDARRYLTQVNALKRQFARLAAST